MQAIICPLDGAPCDPECPDRWNDRPEGGCLLSMLMEHSDASLITSGNFHTIIFNQGGGENRGKA